MRAAALLLLALLPACARSSPRLVLGTTHTLEDSGLVDSLRVWFRAAHPEVDLQVVVAGSGEVLEMGRRGDVDVLLTHAPADEDAMLRSGYAVERQPVMHNDFLVLGPASDPAKVHEATSAREAFRRIRDTKAPFVSRGDDSGTHKKERQLWAGLGTIPDWPNYIEAGSGMADALRLAAERQSYILSDRATWEVLGAQLALAPAFEGDTVALRNTYSVLLVHAPLNPKGATTLFDWITSDSVKQRIGAYGAQQYGRPIFVPEPKSSARPVLELPGRAGVRSYRDRR